MAQEHAAPTREASVPDVRGRLACSSLAMWRAAAFIDTSSAFSYLGNFRTTAATVLIAASMSHRTPEL